MFRHINVVRGNIIKVAYTIESAAPRDSILIADDFEMQSSIDAKIYHDTQNGQVYFKDKRGETFLTEMNRSLTEKQMYKYIVEGAPIVKYKQTANGEVAYIENMRQEPVGIGYGGTIEFSITSEEGLYGLGQHENGVYNYNSHREYLYQNNMKIAIPFIISSRNYGILIDTQTALVFEAQGGKMTFELDCVNELSYYIIGGSSFDEIIKSLRELTGKTAMLPRWAYGYVQSKEHYRTSDELIDTVSEFRKLNIPIDVIVQDWNTWDEGMWGEKRADKSRYPDLKHLLGSLHTMNTKLMVSVWPNMAERGNNYREFKEKDMFLPNSGTYDAFNEDARALYWKQCNEEWFLAGVDAWWCDNTEPFSDADWSGSTKRPEEVRYNLVVETSKQSMDWTRLNSYGLYHAKGVYENWRKSGSDKRVVNLTRSSYISGQRYGVIPWSGDVCAKWTVLKKQIAEGISFSLSGQPYWTTDIGGFFVVKDKWENRGCGKAGDDEPLWFWDGDYNDGAADLGYRELYVRWLQFAAFLPMFRSHGTDTPREPWQFGKCGEMFYDAIIKFIRLRYRLMPYIYSMAASVCQCNETMIRSLLFDFMGDENVKNIADCYMFGKALLVCPVTEPMYYEANSVPITDKAKTKTIYLPKPACWYDFWTKKIYEGGLEITCDAALDKLPLFVRAGSILPLSDELSYAGERMGDVSEILVYAGADGQFALYNDDGDNYSHEQGNFSLIPIVYNDEDTMISFGDVSGTFRHQEEFKVRLVTDGSISDSVVIKYDGKETKANLTLKILDNE